MQEHAVFENQSRAARERIRMLDDDAPPAKDRALNASGAQPQRNASDVLTAAVPEDGCELPIRVSRGDPIRWIVLDSGDERLDERREHAHTDVARVCCTAACTLARRRRAESFHENARARSSPA